MAAVINKLNPNKPFSRIVGECTECPVAMYRQKGRYFDQQGRWVEGSVVAVKNPQTAVIARRRQHALRVVEQREREGVALVAGSAAVRRQTKAEKGESKLAQQLRAQFDQPEAQDDSFDQLAE